LFVEVETNGTVRPLPELLLRIDQWNVSPKLGNSGVPREKRIKPTVLPVFRESGAYFKFVVRTESDAREVDALVQEFALMPEHVLLMPEASDAQVLRARSPEVKSWALARGMRFSGRLHLELFGARRGV
jgi:hypothetical protein